MSFWDEDYNFDDSAWGETEWDMPYRENYSGDFWNPDEFKLPEWQDAWAKQPEPQFNFNLPQPEQQQPWQPDILASRAMYEGNSAADPASVYDGPQEQIDPRTGTRTFGQWAGDTAGKAGNWASNNPKDVFGMATGAGLGIAGLLMKEGNVGKPDMGPLNAARSALEAQAAKTSRINDPLYEESVGAMRGEIAKGGGQHDPRLVQERAQQRAELYAKMIPGDIRDRAMNDFDRQTASFLEDDSTRRSQMRMGNYQIGANTGNPQQTTNVFSRLADAGIQGASLQQQGATTNAQLQEARRNSMLTAGGNIFGRSVAQDPFEAGIDPRTGKKRTSL